ncbi:MAG: leucine--tRNA ligase [Chlamydiota bacterium]
MLRKKINFKKVVMEQKKYHHQAIEKKWQTYWDKHQTFKATIDKNKPKYYILDMFPYPSGAGLHVGHVTGYTSTDVIARYKRQQGYNVLHPMGWDSFGLPAEQYAIRTGTHPKVTTEASIETYKRQLSSLGFSYDWSREIATSEPSYYKWTQWLFTKLYEKGLAYEAEAMVNFCPALGTVLANEEVEDGVSKEGGYPVVKKALRQWILKITAYADRLLEDLDELDWPDYLKKLQRNWIGKSEGVNLTFKILDFDEVIETFTTRIDTIFGLSYLVLAPEHPLVDKVTTADQKNSVEAYKKQTASKADLERTELNKDKSGVWTGAYAEHPITKQKLPIWIADYVLTGYGTGAVMAVPAHDTRDFEFAKKYGCEVKVVYDPDLEGFSQELPKGVSEQEIRQQVLSGELCWGFDGKCINSTYQDLSLEGLSIEQAKEKATAWLEKQGKAKKTTTYKLRDWLFSRQRYWAEPFPILHFEDGTKRALSVDELPLCPPELQDFKPSGDGQSPLAKVKQWVEIVDPKTGKKAYRETNTMPQWAGSCWYYLRFCDPCNTEAAFSKEAEKYWMPVDLYVGGVEHAVLHLLYARFWHKVFFDCGLVSTKEPFKSLRNQGLVTAKAYKLDKGGYLPESEVVEDQGLFFDKEGHSVKCLIEKMSKSKLNGVSPDEIIEEYGADTLRLYEMFMSPFDKEKLWNNEAISGCKRFLNRFYDLVNSDKVSDTASEEALKLGHKLIHNVQHDIEAMAFNTAISKMMEFMNDFSPLAFYPKEVLLMAIKALYPFAPHFAEECHFILGGKESLTYLPFPKVDPKYLIEEAVTYVVQVNGKVRGRLDLAKDIPKDEVIARGKDIENVKKHLEGHKILKEIFLPRKLLNIVIND